MHDLVIRGGTVIDGTGVVGVVGVPGVNVTLGTLGGGCVPGVGAEGQVGRCVH